MEAQLVDALPEGEGWMYEPKWDGFRCLAFKDGDVVILQSKAGQPLGRYFPEIVASVQALPVMRVVLDGEIVPVGQGTFDDLLQRIHPAASRIKKLSTETPMRLVLFDLLVDEKGRSLLAEPLRQRRVALEAFAARHIDDTGAITITQTTSHVETARGWLTKKAGIDGVMAKLLDEPYRSGERTAMQKVKRIRTADCVVAGFRWNADRTQVGSLLLGMFGDDGKLHHVGFTSSFTRAQRATLLPMVKPLIGGTGFTGRSPGGPSRWSNERSGEWVKLEPKLVVEVKYDHFTTHRFRHGTKLLRFRTDKAPRQCTLDQVKR